MSLNSEDGRITYTTPNTVRLFGPNVYAAATAITQVTYGATHHEDRPHAVTLVRADREADAMLAASRITHFPVNSPVPPIDLVAPTTERPPAEWQAVIQALQTETESLRTFRRLTLLLILPLVLLLVVVGVGVIYFQWRLSEQRTEPPAESIHTEQAEGTSLISREPTSVCTVGKSMPCGTRFW
ncbi:MAG: hypothetical protein HY314_10560 [Acidobacteria bacterium]|nr:hypothetical protein [Acidobacteriota bacterium]